MRVEVCYCSSVYSKGKENTVSEKVIPSERYHRRSGPGNEHGQPLFSGLDAKLWNTVTVMDFILQASWSGLGNPRVLGFFFL